MATLFPVVFIFLFIAHTLDTTYYFMFRDTTEGVWNGNSKNPYKCAKCFQSFAKTRQLNKHMRIHFATDPFQCAECPEAFAALAVLKHHMSAHNEDKSFRCTECSKLFNTR
jgi:DNA-directed RNA polymerase subunit RPC12/RpoP